MAQNEQPRRPSITYVKVAPVFIGVITQARGGQPIPGIAGRTSPLLILLGGISLVGSIGIVVSYLRRRRAARRA